MSYNDPTGYNADGTMLDEEIKPGVTLRDWLLKLLTLAQFLGLKD